MIANHFFSKCNSGTRVKTVSKTVTYKLVKKTETIRAKANYKGRVAEGL